MENNQKQKTHTHKKNENDVSNTETSQFIFSVNQLTGFYMIDAFPFNDYI